MSEVFKAYHEAVLWDINFCWWPRIPCYGRMNLVIKEKK